MPITVTPYPLLDPRRRNDWVALADPVEVFAFDFSASLENMRPASAPHELLFTEVLGFRAWGWVACSGPGGVKTPLGVGD